MDTKNIAATATELFWEKMCDISRVHEIDSIGGDFLSNLLDEVLSEIVPPMIEAIVEAIKASEEPEDGLPW